MVVRGRYELRVQRVHESRQTSQTPGGVFAPVGVGLDAAPETVGPPDLAGPQRPVDREGFGQQGQGNVNPSFGRRESRLFRYDGGFGHPAAPAAVRVIAPAITDAARGTLRGRCAVSRPSRAGFTPEAGGAPTTVTFQLLHDYFLTAVRRPSRV